MKAFFVLVSLVISGVLGTALCLGLLFWCGNAAFSIVVLKQAVVYKQEAALALGAYLVLMAVYAAGKAAGERKVRGSFDFLFW
jgi:hypothetical protein